MAARVLERELDDITLAQYRVLTLIASSPERAGRVAERASMSRPSLTGILDGLVNRGWVRRSEVAGDRRGVYLEVTTAGRARIKTADTVIAHAMHDVFAELDDEEANGVLTQLTVLQQALSARFTRRMSEDR